MLKPFVRFLVATPPFIAQVAQQPSVRVPLAIGLGAIAGALSRFYLNLWIGRVLGITFPYGTFLINLSGCLAMGFFFTTVTERIFPISPDVQLLVAVGFLGSYTTFSTYSLDTVNLARGEQFFKAALYWIASSLGGLLCLYLGIWLAQFGRFHK
ncbi:fluoride efflux transporter CrcB [Lusitaniella coriacea LEGE 07157]|uniref:Fluoride-specific ion channel FluC n=1 Tax=Lusitaniella coriacea LEGE 07157 TaxID=945747 RepID=A0A8J7DSU4_9CYAN|nr:fluoride efflux transporter CrcB [Lusitaniella coriacea]MBE9114772.1 fluoride efflux transporter CrcB [Lusitaniella coriacea LEGE 07157]